jgi:hypothetical protein
MTYVPLDIADAAAGVAFVPSEIEFFSGAPQLHDEVTRKVLWLGFATLLPP